MSTKYVNFRNFDIDKLSFGAPKQMPIPKKKKQFYYIMPSQYLYDVKKKSKSSDDKKKRDSDEDEDKKKGDDDDEKEVKTTSVEGSFRMEGPLSESSTGLRENREDILDKDEEVVGEKISHSIPCIMPNNSADQKLFISILNQIFNKAAEYIEKHRGALPEGYSEFEAKRAKSCGLKPLLTPAMDKETKKPKIGVDPSLWFKLVNQVSGYSKKVSHFCLADDSPLAWGDLMNATIKMFPMFDIEHIYVGAKPSVPIKLVSAIVDDIIPISYEDAQKETTAEMKKDPALIAKAAELKKLVAIRAEMKKVEDAAKAANKDDDSNKKGKKGDKKKKKKGSDDEDSDDDSDKKKKKGGKKGKDSNGSKDKSKKSSDDEDSDDDSDKKKKKGGKKGKKSSDDEDSDNDSDKKKKKAAADKKKKKDDESDDESKDKSKDKKKKNDSEDGDDKPEKKKDTKKKKDNEDSDDKPEKKKDTKKKNDDDDDNEDNKPSSPSTKPKVSKGGSSLDNFLNNKKAPSAEKEKKGDDDEE